jgi:type IV secretory pathway TraG/TraD family ATPase VirD4
VSTIGLAAFSRADQLEEKRKPFFLYVDEFQHFTTLSVVSMLSELRKYRVGMVFAHQYVHQLSPDIRHAIFGNVGSVLVFRVGAEDAPILCKELFELFELSIAATNCAR